jgi:hypothetical protein
MSDSEELSIAKFIRFKNGDDIIAESYEYSDDTGEFYTVINPLKVIYVPASSAGYMQIAFIPWIYPRICDAQEFNIAKQEVLLYHDVSEKMNEYYWDSVEHYLNAKRETFEEEVEEEPEHSEEDYEALKEALEELTLKRTLH